MERAIDAAKGYQRPTGLERAVVADVICHPLEAAMASVSTAQYTRQRDAGEWQRNRRLHAKVTCDMLEWIQKKAREDEELKRLLEGCDFEEP